MTRKEASEYKKELVDKYYKKEITWEEYKGLWDAIEIEDYDLSAFPQLNEDITKWINILFQDAPEISRNGNYMLRGFTQNYWVEMEKLGLSFGDCADDLSFYAYNDDQMLIYSYCEGDTTLQIFSDKEKYGMEKQSQREWYRKERCA